MIWLGTLGENFGTFPVTAYYKVLINGDKFMNYKRKENLKIITVIIFICLIFLSFNSELMKNVPDIFLISVDNIEDLMNSLFTVQASISTIGIALIALLSGASKEKLYGLTVSRFIMQIRPCIFRHRTIIVTELLLIVASYILLALECYNPLIAVFVISDALVIIMLLDIFKIFYGVDDIKGEIEEYYLLSFESKNIKVRITKNDVFNNLYSSVSANLQLGDSIAINENLDLMSLILDAIIKENDNIVLREFEKNSLDIFNVIFQSNNKNSWMDAIDKIYEFYEKCNNRNRIIKDNKIYLNIFNMCFENYVNSLSKLPYNEIESKIYSSNQIKLYENIDYENGYPMNNSFLSIFYAKLYFLLADRKESDDDKYYTFNINIFKELYNLSLRKFVDYEEGKDDLVYTGLLNYIKVLIDNKEIYILKETYIERLKLSYGSKDNEVKYFLIILIYIYYLGFEEILVPEDKKKFISNLLNESRQIISFYLNRHKGELFYKEFEDLAIEKLRAWEIMPDHGGKLIIMSNVIKKFIIMNGIYYNGDKDYFKDILSTYIINRGFIFYNDFVGDKKSFNKEDYIIFIKEFLNEGRLSNEGYKNSIDMKLFKFNDYVKTIYKENEMKSRAKHVKNEVDFQNLKRDIEKDITQKIKEQFHIFNREWDYTYNKKIDIFNLDSDISFLNSDDIISNFYDILKNQIINIFFKLIESNLISEDIDKSIHGNINFFDNINSLVINVDTLILCNEGSFYPRLDYNKLKLLKEKCTVIETYGGNDFIIALDKQYVQFNINSVNVKINEITFTELIEIGEIKQEPNGRYVSTIINGVELSFTEAELKEHIYNTRRRLTFELNYCFSVKEGSDKFGVCTFLF